MLRPSHIGGEGRGGCKGEREKKGTGGGVYLHFREEGPFNKPTREVPGRGRRRKEKVPVPIWKKGKKKENLLTPEGSSQWRKERGGRMVSNTPWRGREGEKGPLNLSILGKGVGLQKGGERGWGEERYYLLEKKKKEEGCFSLPRLAKGEKKKKAPT